MEGRKTIDKCEFLNDVKEVLSGLNEEIHSDTPPIETYGDITARPLKHGHGWVEFNIDGVVGDTIDWTGKPIEDFHGKIFAPSLNKEPARIELHDSKLHVNADGRHIFIDLVSYQPINTTAGSYLVGYPGKYEDLKSYLDSHFFGTTE